MKETKFIDVIIPLSVPYLYTYRIPFELNDFIQVGQRVIIQFGKSKYYTAVVNDIHGNPPEKYQAKYIDSILDEKPLVTKNQLKLWHWISEYYMCNPGDVLNAALPASLKLASETKVILHPDYSLNPKHLNDKEYIIAEALEVQGTLTLKDISEILGIKTIQPIIKKLVEKQVIMMEEELKHRYKPKTEKFVSLNEFYSDEDNLKDLFEVLEKKKSTAKQLDLVLAFLHLTNQSKLNEVSKKELLRVSNSSDSSLKTLAKKSILNVYGKEVNRLSVGEGGTDVIKELSEAQLQAFKDIKSNFGTKNINLLHGVTSSGKTEVYVKLIKEYIERGEQVLYLLPEIALTTQIIVRLRKYFGDKIGVYHSKFNPNERAEVWNRTMINDDKQFKILLGARSSIFLPFQNLGLIIVDEEHETSFKQHEPAPRYNARDTAFVLAKLHSAKVLLGSATPSIEVYWNALQGNFGLVELTKRFGGVKLPEILCADIGKETRRKEMKSLFSSMLMAYIEDAFENKEQVILFQNRRGYAPLWQCESCGWTPQCNRCDVSLTYHKFAHLLNCHYCGYSTHPPKQCEACGDHKLKMVGFGTEKIEDELSIFFPDKTIKRMDLDTTRSKNAYQNIITDFENGNIDVLVGTQMITKGLDFDNVALVGVLNADTMLNFPDFRSFERSFQLLSQVSGRAGRNKKRGKVIIQTYNPNHWIIQQVIKNDYKTMYDQEILERKNFHYPPFYRLIKITLKHKEKNQVMLSANFLADNLKKQFGNRVLGPEAPYVERVRNLYIRHITLKFERNFSAKKVKDLIKDEILNLRNNTSHKSVRVTCDVDPS